jgi:hypothetical protein
MSEQNKRLAAMIHVADLKDKQERAELADAIEEAGRQREADILRSKCKAMAHAGEVWRVAETAADKRVFVLLDSTSDPGLKPLTDCDLDGPVYVGELRETDIDEASFLGAWVCWGSESFIELTKHPYAGNFMTTGDLDLDRCTGRSLRGGERLVVVCNYRCR